MIKIYFSRIMKVKMILVLDYDWCTIKVMLVAVIVKVMFHYSNITHENSSKHKSNVNGSSV